MQGSSGAVDHPGGGHRDTPPGGAALRHLSEVLIPALARRAYYARDAKATWETDKRGPKPWDRRAYVRRNSHTFEPAEIGSDRVELTIQYCAHAHATLLRWRVNGEHRPRNVPGHLPAGFFPAAWCSYPADRQDPS